MNQMTVRRIVAVLARQLVSILPALFGHVLNDRVDA
jgi:hypothetical protein